MVVIYLIGQRIFQGWEMTAIGTFVFRDGMLVRWFSVLAISCLAIIWWEKFLGFTIVLFLKRL